MSCTNLVKFTYRDVLCVPNDICYLSRDFSKYVNATGYLKNHESIPMCTLLSHCSESKSYPTLIYGLKYTSRNEIAS